MLRRSSLFSPTSVSRVFLTGMVEFHHQEFQSFVNSERVSSVSKWTPKDARMFTFLRHEPFLALPIGEKMPFASADFRAAQNVSTAMKVFSELNLDKQKLQDASYDRRRQLYEEVGIEKVMESIDYAPKYPAGRRASRLYMEDILRIKKHDNILEKNQLMVSCLAAAAKQEMKPAETANNSLDMGATELLRLCEFRDDPLEMRITGQEKFKIFGRHSQSTANQYVIQTPGKELVIVWRADKTVREGEPIPEKGHVAQIVGEMLKMQAVNRENKEFPTVFAIRYINYNVTCFRLDVDKVTLDTLVETGRFPAKDLKLICSVKDPTTDRGLSLIDKGERGAALKVLTAIRKNILNN